MSIRKHIVITSRQALQELDDVKEARDIKTRAKCVTTLVNEEHYRLKLPNASN